MATYKFFVKGQPVPKQSFRATVETDAEGKVKRRGGYTPAKVKHWASAVGYAAKEVIRQPIPGHVSVSLYFALVDNRVVDLDNLSKNVLDGLKGVAFGDDCKVTELYLKKCIDKQYPGVWITIKPVIPGTGKKKNEGRVFSVLLDEKIIIAKSTIYNRDDFQEFLVRIMHEYPDDFLGILED